MARAESRSNLTIRPSYGAWTCHCPQALNQRMVGFLEDFIMKCQIQWIDERGNTTPDENEAIGTVYREEYVWQWREGGIPFDRTEPMYICAEHAKRLAEPSMHHWVFTTLPEDLPAPDFTEEGPTLSECDTPDCVHHQHNREEIGDTEHPMHARPMPLPDAMEALHEAEDSLDEAKEAVRGLQIDLASARELNQMSANAIAASLDMLALIPVLLRGVIEDHSHLCLDNQKERDHLLSEMLAALSIQETK